MSALSMTQVERFFGVKYSDRQLALLAESQYSPEVITTCKDTHILFPGYPLSIVDIRDKHRHLFTKHCLYGNERFAGRQLNVQWHLLRRQEFPGSLGKPSLDQICLLSRLERVPRACEVTFMVILHFLATGERLLEHTYVRCSDKNSDDHHVSVGHFDDEGLGIFGNPPDHSPPTLGLASYWKS